MKVSGKFLEWKGLELGVSGLWPQSWEELIAKVEGEVGPLVSSIRAREQVGRLGIITGGAGSEVEAVRRSGIDTFLTGEGPHWSFPLAEEIGLSVIHAGHYATEVFGVKKVGLFLKERFGVEFNFLAAPTGL